MLPQPWYVRSILFGLTIVTVSFTVGVRPVSSLYRTCSTPQLKSYSISGSSTTSPLMFEINYIGCQFSRELNTKCVSWCTSVCIRLHQLAELCSPVSQSANRGHLRSAARGDLAVPRSRTTRNGQRSLPVSGPTLWNSLPLSVRDPSLTLSVRV